MKDQAFVIMQIGDKDTPERKRADELFQFVIAPAVAQFSLKAYRADLDPSPGSITPKLLGELLDSKVVIADLTGRNPNVFYELGVTHSFARPLISVADSASNLPFDTKDERVIELGAYVESGLTYAQGEDAKVSLVSSLNVVLNVDYTPPSPIRELAVSHSLDALAPSNPMATEIGYIREVLEEIRHKVTQRTVARIPDGMRADIAALRTFIAKIADSHALDEEELASLVTRETTLGHDEWAKSLTEGRGATTVLAPADPWVARRAPISPNYVEPPF